MNDLYSLSFISYGGLNGEGGLFNFLPLKRWGGGGLIRGRGAYLRVGLIEDLRYYSKSFVFFLLGRRHEFEAYGTGRIFD